MCRSFPLFCLSPGGAHAHSHRQPQEAGSPALLRPRQNPRQQRSKQRLWAGRHEPPRWGNARLIIKFVEATVWLFFRILRKPDWSVWAGLFFRWSCRWFIFVFTEKEQEPKLTCEYCGWVDFAYTFKGSKRFCSVVCAKRQVTLFV